MLHVETGWGKSVLTLFSALVFGACFAGGFVQGLECASDAECGPQLSCRGGHCGGLGDPALCGNGLLDFGEECDDGNLGEGDLCTPSCQLPVCGDGYIGPQESCDDGNLVDGDGCSVTCQQPSECGNGVVESGEECDDGNSLESDGCTPTCRLPVCGDGFLGAGEECDDGNEIGTDACTPNCTKPICGDGYVNAEAEVCDDGNAVENDECTTACTASPEAPVLELGLAQVKQFEFRWAPALGAEWYELFERTDVGEEFAPVGDTMIAGESFSLTVPVLYRVNSGYKLRACNERRCAESEVVDVMGSLAEASGYFKASNPDGGDWFGAQVALSGDGNTLAVGAPRENSAATGIGGEEGDNSVYSAGAVYVFTRVSNTWEQQAYVKASNTDEGDRFGASVALSGDGKTLAVGASSERSSSTGIGGDEHDNSAFNAGAVYVFTRAAESWEQQAYVKGSNTGAGDGFGRSVALSGEGKILAVGASSERSSATGIGGDEYDNSVPGAGAVYVFTRTAESWKQQAYVKASNTGEGDSFGSSVALSESGDTLAVGAPFEASSATGIGGDEADNSADNAGSVYVFGRTGDLWKQQAYVKASNTGEWDLFGHSVAISEDGTTLAVGAPWEDSNARGLDGDGTNDSAFSSGAVYIFTRTAETWAEQAYVKASNTGEGDNFGSSVVLSGDGKTLAVGANGERSRATGLGGDENDNSAVGAGAAFVFVQTGDAWKQHTYVKAAYTRGDDGFGTAIALSDDAQTLAIGAPGDNYATAGVGNPLSPNAAFDSGAVYVY